MQRFKVFFTITALFCGLILMSQTGETGEETETDGSLAAKVRAVFSGPVVKSKARASSGYDIRDGIYDVYAEVDDRVDEHYNSYSRSIYKLAKKSRRKQHNSSGTADSMIDGYDRHRVLWSASAHTTT